MEGEQWTRTTGDGDREREERERKEGGKKTVLEGTEAWLTWIGA